jgi:hypothetical protein
MYSLDRRMGAQYAKLQQYPWRLHESRWFELINSSHLSWIVLDIVIANLVHSNLWICCLFWEPCKTFVTSYSFQHILVNIKSAWIAVWSETHKQSCFGSLNYGTTHGGSFGFGFNYPFSIPSRTERQHNMVGYHGQFGSNQQADWSVFLF